LLSTGHRPWRARRQGLATLAALAAAALAGCGGSGATVASLPPLHPGRPGPASMFTPAGELTQNPSATLDELRRLGVDSVHIYMHWADIAPDASSPRRPSFNAADPAAYPASGWATYDAIVRGMAARGMTLYVALVPPVPRWASAPGAPQPASQTEWRPSAAQFEHFVRAVGIRYSGQYVPPGATQPLPRVKFWAIWNEPNLGIDLAPEAMPHSTVEVAPRFYRGLVNAAWTALHATGHGEDTILIGELAPAGATFGDAPGLFAAMAPLRFLRALYCVDAAYRPLTGAAAVARGCPTTPAVSSGFAGANPGLFHASGFADHPYPQGLAPNQVTPDEPDYAELAEVGKLEHTLDTLQRVYGSHTRFPIYSTEYGYQTHPPDIEAGTVTQAVAAVYLNWSEYLTWLDPRLRTYDQYLMTDPTAGYFATGLKSASGVPKPAYAAFRMPIYLPVTSTARGHALVVWGCVRPAPNAALLSHRPQRARIQFQASGASAWRTVRAVTITNPHGYFELAESFPSSGTVRLAWKYPDGHEITSRAAVIKLR
jgi:hypothetical protein